MYYTTAFVAFHSGTLTAGKKLTPPLNVVNMDTTSPSLPPPAPAPPSLPPPPKKKAKNSKVDEPSD